MENSQKSRLVIFPGGARNHLGNDWLRRWPVESYLKLTQLATEAQVPVAVFGTKSDSWALEAFSGMTEVTVKQFEGDVTHTIQELCPSDVVLTHDSGPFHFAQLSGAYVVGLFGPTLPESRYGPDFSGETISAPKRLPCQPCYNGRNYANCSNNQCLTTISAEQVWQQVSRHFEEQTR